MIRLETRCACSSLECACKPSSHPLHPYTQRAASVSIQRPFNMNTSNRTTYEEPFELSCYEDSTSELSCQHTLLIEHQAFVVPGALAFAPPWSAWVARPPDTLPSPHGEGGKGSPWTPVKHAWERGMISKGVACRWSPKKRGSQQHRTPVRAPWDDRPHLSSSTGQGHHTPTTAVNRQWTRQCLWFITRHNRTQKPLLTHGTRAHLAFLSPPTDGLGWGSSEPACHTTSTHPTQTEKGLASSKVIVHTCTDASPGVQRTSSKQALHVLAGLGAT